MRGVAVKTQMLGLLAVGRAASIMMAGEML
jgi:hypothetical protein